MDKVRLSNVEEWCAMEEEIEKILTKAELAERYSLAVSTVNTWCSRSPSSLPPFFKLGSSSNSAIRFRVRDCLEFERKQLAKQEMVNRANATVDLSDLC